MCQKLHACHTQNDSHVSEAPRLPRITDVDVAKYQSCLAKVPQCHGRPSRPKRVTRPSHASEVPRPPRKRQPCVRSATLATQNERGCRQVPRLPRKSPAASRPTKQTQARHQTQPCVKVPRLPRKTNVNVAKRHACHAKRTWMSPSTTPAVQECRGVTGDQADPSASPDPAMCQKCHVKDGV